MALLSRSNPFSWQFERRCVPMTREKKSWRKPDVKAIEAGSAENRSGSKLETPGGQAVHS